MLRVPLLTFLAFTLSGCATIVNDANIPLTVSFSDGSSGECTFKNKRGTWTSPIPTQGVMIRRSDDALVYECTTSDGRESNGSIRSEMEGGKMAASVVFLDLGITDAITDKHRTYQGNVVIPVTSAKKSASVSDGPVEVSAEKRATLRKLSQSLNCQKSVSLKERTQDSELWLLDCGDGESLEIRCFEEECYVKNQ